MSDTVRSGSRRPRARLAILGGAVALGVLLGMRGVWVAARPLAARGLVLEPATADLTDRVHREDEPVRARFRLVNPQARPVVVKELATSCTCTASLVEGGKTAPFTLAPGAAIDFWLDVHPIPQSDLIEVVRAVISSEVEGRPLPTVVALMRILVEDPPKPNPPAIHVGDAPAGEPVRRQFILTTASATTKVGRPEVTSSDPALIRATLASGGPTGVFEDRLTGHYRVDVELAAPREVESIAGDVEVKVHGRVIRVPVDCTFHRPYRLSRKAIALDGRPGETVTADLYYESREPGWEQPEPVMMPPGVELAVRPFDASTWVLGVRARMPEAGAGPAGPAIIVRPRGRDDRIAIPIRYNAGG